MLSRAGSWLFGRPYLLLALTMASWGVNVGLGRYIVGTVPPVALAQLRWTGAALILLPFAWPHLKRDWPAFRGKWWLVLVASFTGIAFYNTATYYGLQYTEAINGLLAQSMAPLLIGLWSYLFFRDRLTRNQLAGIVLSFFGVAAIIARGDPAALPHLRFNAGDVWILTAIALWAMYSSLLRLRPDVHWLSFLAITIIVGQFMIMPAYAVELWAGYGIHWSPAAIWVIAYVVVVPSILAYLFYNRGVELIGANRSGPFFHLIAVFGSIFAIAFLGERPQWFHGVGYALIILGIVVAQRRSAAAAPRPSPIDSGGAPPQPPPSVYPREGGGPMAGQAGSDPTTTAVLGSGPPPSSA